MQKIGLVDFLERIEQGRDNAVEFLLARRAAQTLQPTLETLALLEVEHHVAGVVGAEVAVDAHDIRVREFGERLRFLDEAVETPAIIARAILRTGCGFDAAGAGREVRWEIFLDRDGAVERDFVREVSHAEAACTEHALDAIIANEFRSGRQSD